jgi:hypothetical protein
MVEMTTPQQRLDRMRKSFAKNKSVLTEDYKYFITPDKLAKQRTKQPERGSVKCHQTRYACFIQGHVDGLLKLFAEVSRRLETRGLFPIPVLHHGVLHCGGVPGG